MTEEEHEQSDRDEVREEFHPEMTPEQADGKEGKPGLDDDIKCAIEALIFASEEPLPQRRIREIIEEGGTAPDARIETDAGTAEESDGEEATDSPGHRSPRRKTRRGKDGLTPQRLGEYIDALNSEYASSGRSFRIIPVSGGYAFQTTKEFGAYIGRLLAEKIRRRLTHSALETLAIIAFRQPVSKPMIEALRGVNADFVLKSLLEKNLITIVGREESVGRPLLYGTTETFLRHFGLARLEDLPKPREIEELLAEEESISRSEIEYDSTGDQQEREVVISPEEGIFKTLPYGDDFVFETGSDAPGFIPGEDQQRQTQNNDSPGESGTEHAQSDHSGDGEGREDESKRMDDFEETE